MKRLSIITLIITSLTLLAEPPAQPKRYAITDKSIPKGSVEEFVAGILLNARKEKYEKLKPHFGWTWNEFYGTWGPEYPWKNVHKAASENDIFIYKSEKSNAHNNVYYFRVECFTEKKRRRGSSLMVVQDNNEFKLGVQANGSKTGNLFVILGYSKKYTLSQLSKITTIKPEEAKSELVVNLNNGHQLKCIFNNDENLESMEFKVGDKWLHIFLVVFDLEGTPTIKLRN